MSGETMLTVIGRLTADPELRYTQSGKPVANFTIASNSRIFDRQTNEWKDGETLFMRCAAWRNAEAIAELTKGSPVIAQGPLKQKSYEKDGKTVSYIELDVQTIGRMILDLPRNAGQQEQGWGKPQEEPGAPQDRKDDTGSWNAPAGYDSEVPF